MALKPISKIAAGVQGGGRGAAFGPAAWVLLHARPPPFVCRGTHMRGSFTPIYGKGGADMKQKSSQMRFAPWPVVQAALALALSGLLLARPRQRRRACGGAEALRRQPTARAVPTVCGVRPAGAAGSGAGVAAAAFDAAVRDPQPTGPGGAGAGLVWWIRGVRPTDCSIAQNGGTAPAGCRAPAAVGLLFRPRLCGWLHWGAAVWQRGAGAAAVWLAAGSQPCCRSLPGAIFAKAGIASWAGEQSTKERDLPTGHQQCGAKQPDGVRLRGVLPCGGQCVGQGCLMVRGLT